MIPEFIGRLPVVSVLDQLSVADLEKVLLTHQERDGEAVCEAIRDGRRAASASPRDARHGHRASEPSSLRRAHAPFVRSMEGIMLDVMYDLPAARRRRRRSSSTQAVVELAARRADAERKRRSRTTPTEKRGLSHRGLVAASPYDRGLVERHGALPVEA